MQLWFLVLLACSFSVVDVIALKSSNIERSIQIGECQYLQKFESADIEEEDDAER